jgi:hypothetical protein
LSDNRFKRRRDGFELGHRFNGPGIRKGFCDLVEFLLRAGGDPVGE